MKDFSRRKQEAEEKLRKVERQKKASEEWDKLTSGVNVTEHGGDRRAPIVGLVDSSGYLPYGSPGSRAVGQGLASHPTENPAV